MPSKRRLQGIAALSAGALAAGMIAPAGSAQSPDDGSELDPAAAAASEAALRAWEAARGVDVPDDLFDKLEGAADDPFFKLADMPGDPGSGALLRTEYLPATDTAAAAIVKYDYSAAAAGDAFSKVEYTLDDPEAAAFLDGLEEAFAKVEMPGADPGGDDPFPKIGDLVGDAWAFRAGAQATDDAFMKIVVPEEGAAAALVEWEYDAIDLIELALLERAGSTDATSEADPPIDELLQQVRGLRSAAPSVNAFVERDQAMRSLPLPKKLPADAGTYATPRAGRWRAVNLPGTVRCGSFTTRIPKSATDRATLEVLDGGERLVGRELGEKGSRFVVTADPGITGRYTGSVNLKAQGGRVDMDLTMQLITDKHIVGTAKVTVKAGGQRCKINRGFDVKYRGE